MVCGHAAQESRRLLWLLQEGSGMGKPASTMGWEPSRSGRSPPASPPPAATSAASRAIGGRCNVTGGWFRLFPTAGEGCRCRWFCREESAGSMSCRDPCSRHSPLRRQDGSSPAAPSCPPRLAATHGPVLPACSARQLPAHAARPCLQLAETGSASLLCSHPRASLACSSGSHFGGNAPETALK